MLYMQSFTYNYYVCSYFQPDVVNDDGYTPFGQAIIHKRLEVIKYFITEQNVDPKGTY